MERILILSDIHSNKLALEAVQKDSEITDRIWFLGDLFGYGVYPIWVYQNMKMLSPEIWLKGNHDWAICGDEECYGGMNDLARYSADDHIVNLSINHLKEVNIFGVSTGTSLGAIPIFLAHGIPWGDEHGSVTKYHKDIAPRKQEERFANPLEIREKYTPEFNIWIVGHSHVQTAWLWEHDRQAWRLFDGFGTSLFGNSSRKRLSEGQRDLKKIEIAISEIRKDDLLILNPGSVGFPRDISSTSSAHLSAMYMILELSKKCLTIKFRRVIYNGAELLSLAEKSYPPELYKRFKSEILYLK